MSNGHYLFIKKSSHSLTGVNLPLDYPHPRHITCQKCPPSIFNIYIMSIMSFMSKQGGLQLCTPPSHRGGLPLDCARVQLLHQVQAAIRLRHLLSTGSISLRIDIYKSRWWNVKTAELRISFCSPAPALMDNVMLLRPHSLAYVLKIALLKVFRLVLSLYFFLLYNL